MKNQFKGFAVSADIFNVPDLSIYEQSAYIVLQSFSNPHTDMAFPSYNDIAKFGRMSRVKAIQAVKGLLDKGLIKKDIRINYHKEKGVINDSNRYTLLDPSTLVGGSTQRELGGSTQRELVHGVNHGGSTQREPLILKEIILKEIDRLIDAPIIRDFLMSLHENLKPEHIEPIKHCYSLHKANEAYSDAMFVVKLKKVLDSVKRIKSDFFSYFNRAVSTELNRLQAEKAQLRIEEQKKAQQTQQQSMGKKGKGGKGQKPRLEVVSNGTPNLLSEEERKELREKAAMLEAMDKQRQNELEETGWR